MIDKAVPPRRVKGQIVRRVLVWATVALFTLLGLYLRYTYARTSSPYIDEYTTMWVALSTVEHGYPVFPTGAIYAQGLLFTYLDAFLFHLFGFSEWVARVPSLVLSVGTIPLAYWVGKRILADREGLLASALVALDPQSIGWGGRARSYCLLVFLVLLAAYFLYRGVVRQDRAAYRRLALVFLVAAVFAHNEAILLYPAFLVVGLLWRGWRNYLRWPVVLENALTLGGMAVSFYLYRLMQPAGWSEVGEGRGEVTVSVDIVHAWGRLKPFFFGPDQLPFVGLLTFLFLVGVGYLLMRCWREGPSQLFDPTDRDTGLLFLTVLFVVVLLEMVFFVSEGRLGVRYLFMLGSVFFLIASAVLFRSTEFVGGLLGRRTTTVVLSGPQSLLPKVLLTCAILAVATVFSLPASLAAAHRQELPYDVAFKYVREHLRDKDEVMTFATSPCVLYLGKCDYVAVQKEFHAYATQRGDHWVEAWAGAPILFTADALEKAVEEADRMWFVIDQMRFRTRYSSRFIQYVWDHMDLVTREDGVFVFLAEPSPYPPPQVEGRSSFRLGEQAALVGYALNSDVFRPDDVLRLSLRWEGLTHMRRSYSVFVHLVGADSVLWAQSDGAPMKGLLPTSHWVAGETTTDVREIRVPSHIPIGRYRLEVGMYDPDSLERLDVTDQAGTVLGNRIILDYVQVQREPPETSAPQHKTGANLGDLVTLLGYDLAAAVVKAGEPLGMVLYWTTDTTIEQDYTVFVHLTDDTGRMWGESDSQPEKGFYPTSYWDVGGVIRDEHEVMVDSGAPPGIYGVEVGMYLLGTGERLPYTDQEGRATGDALIVGVVEIRD
ncbi:MAG: glycosyltransferase family 39 protein [Anaerolineae bacterium]